MAQKTRGSRRRTGTPHPAIHTSTTKDRTDYTNTPAREYNGSEGPSKLMAELASVACVSPSELERANSDHPSWHATCPLCGQDKLSIDYTKSTRGPYNILLVRCRDCPGAILNEVCAALGISSQQAQQTDPYWDALVGLPFAGARSGPPAPLPSAERIADYRRALIRAPAVRSYLRGRGLTSRTIRAARLGYDPNPPAITIPVYSSAGELVNVRRRILNPAPGAPKIVGLPGRGVQLYPDVDPGTYPLYLCEGEFDALIARQSGLPGAFTGTCGMEWLRDGSWDWAIEDREVAVIYDSGQLDRARARAADLKERGARHAWAVDLGLADGEDLTNFFVDYERDAFDLRRLIDRSRGAS